MSDTTNTSVEELDSHMKDLKVLAMILALMFFVTLGYLYLMTISDNGSEGHPAAVHDEGEAAEGEDAIDNEAENADGNTEDTETDTEADTTDESAADETSFNINGNIYQIVF